MGVKSPGKNKSAVTRAADAQFKEMRASVRDNLDASEERLKRSRQIVSQSKDIVERARQALENAKELHTDLAEDRQKRALNKGRSDDGGSRV